MVEIILFNKDPILLSDLKHKISSLIIEQDYTIITFLYEMDLLDYIHTANPEKYMIFYNENNAQSGIEISMKLYEMNNKGRFCLIAKEYPEKIEDLFYFGISYFILPENEISLKHCLIRFFEYFDESFNCVIRLRKQSAVETIPMNNIEYIMSDKRKIIVYEKDCNHEYYCKLDELEEVTKKLFVRCHQSYLVNMKKIKSFVEDGLILYSGQFIPVSRKKYYSTKNTYLQFVTGSSNVIQL